MEDGETMEFKTVMPRTEAFLREHVRSGGAGSVAVSLGDGTGERWRFFAGGPEGGAQNGKTLYDMMSVTKILVTAPLFHIAMEEGLVSPDDPLGRYFPEAPADKAGIPLWMLLSHCSGLPGRIDFPWPVGPEKREEGIRFQLSQKLLFAPETQYFYSCTGFVLLGFLLERVWNAPLDQLFEEKIAAPLGLSDTCYRPREKTNIVKATVKKDAGLVRCSDPFNRSLYGVSGNAGVFSCLDDMSRFACSLLRGHPDLMRRETFELAARDRTPSLSLGRALGYVYADGRYGQGGGLYSDGTVGHTGFSGTECFADRKQGFFLVSLSNTSLYTAIRKQNCTAACAAFREGLHRAIKQDLE